MSQPYPDPPMTTEVTQGPTKLMSLQWSKWFQGLRVLVNKLSVGQDISGTFTTLDGKTITITNGVVSKIQ
jgi:hypothetical protein